MGKLTRTRKAAAQKVGVSPNTLYRWESDGNIPRPKKAARNGQLFYDDDLIAKAIAFRDKIEEQPSVAQ